MLNNPEKKQSGDRLTADRQFVGREEFVAPVHAALKQPRRTKPLVLVYHGGAGIGKSRLRMELVKQMAADPGVVTATLDFHIPTYRQPEAALFFLRNALHEAHQVRFPSFDLAYAVHWQKSHPEMPLGEEVQPLVEPSSILSHVLDESGKLPLIGLIPGIAALAAKSLESSTPRPLDSFPSDWWQQRGGRELEDLSQMEPGAIVERLPALWAADLSDHLSKKDGKAVLFIDSYEALWDVGSTEADFFKRDEWVRGLVRQLPEVLWIVCGRQKLRWEEVESDWGNALNQRQLGALPEESARRFLESCDITNGQIQDAIVKGSQGVPHYLDLAVDTMQSAKVEGRRTKIRTNSPDEVVAEFTRNLDKPELETLKVLSAARFWYYGLFEHLVTEYQIGYPLNGYDELSRFSFIKEGAAPGTRTMHELMRDALQEDQAPELRKRVHSILHEYYAKQLEGLDLKNTTDQHRLALTEAFYHGQQAQSATELWAWFRTAYYAFDRTGQYRLLIPLSRELVRALEAELGPEHAGMADALLRFAAKLHEQGEYDEAEPLYRRALAIAERNHGPEHPLVCECLVWLTRLLRNRGRYEEAEATGRRAVGVFGKPGVDIDLRRQALGNLASVLIEERKYPEAEEVARHTVAVNEAESGPEHIMTADSLNTLAYLLMMQRRYADAEPFFRRALAIKVKNIGEKSDETMITVDNLGRVLQLLCRYPESEALHRRALQISKEVLGPEHPDTAIAMNNLGTVLREQGRFVEAEELLRQALSVLESKLGSDHPNPTTTASHLMSVLVKMGKYTEAEPMVLAAIESRSRRFGPDRPETAAALHWAGVMRGEQGRYGEAEGYLRRALDIRSRSLGAEHPDTLASLSGLALLEERQGRCAQAESLYRDVLAREERAQGPDHPDVADTANRLAGLCCRDGRHTEAEALYRRALAIREKVFGPDHLLVAETLDGLAKVCEQTGRTAEAQELATRAKRIRAQAEPAPNNAQQPA